ncbi:hypothetical protein Plhal304r1_c083g0167661 [Plasmopara halstedii]
MKFYTDLSFCIDGDGWRCLYEQHVCRQILGSNLWIVCALGAWQVILQKDAPR